MTDQSRPTIDLGTETVISLRQATRYWPSYRHGKPTHQSTVLRAILKGSKAPDGQRVYLGALRIGGRWVTSTEAIQRYAEALTPGHSAEPLARRTPARRHREIARADREAEAIGI